MAGLYGHRWVSAYGDDPRGVGGREWALTLAGLTKAQIDEGLAACRTAGEDWPPSAPAFRARCFGIPSFERVRADIAIRALGFTRLVWEGLDGWAFTRADQRDAERMLRHAYDYAVARRLDGAEIPAEPAGEITHEKRKPTPASPEVAERHAAAIRELLDAGCYADPGVEVGGTRHGLANTTSAEERARIEADLAAHYAKGDEVAP